MSASVINYYKELPKKYTTKRHQYPSYDKYRISIPTRCLVVGGAGSGKTNCTLNMVLGMSCWTRIFLLVKHPEEPLYAFLADEIRKVEKKLGIEILTVSSSLDDLPDLDAFNEKQMTLLILDDLINEKTKDLAKVASFWTRGRHKGFTTIFITQSFFATPKLIRQSTDLVIFKRLSKRDLNLVMSEFSLDRSVAELQEMYRSCHTNNVDEFFMIDNSPGQSPEYQYRHCFSPIG